MGDAHPWTPFLYLHIVFSVKTRDRCAVRQRMRRLGAITCVILSVLSYCLKNALSAADCMCIVHYMGPLQCGLGATQNFGWVGHNVFGPTIWPVCSLILRKISKVGATRCQVLRLKCTKFAFRWGSAPDPAGRAYSAPRPLAVFNGPY